MAMSVGSRVRTAKLWREVELLKGLSHVSRSKISGRLLDEVRGKNSLIKESGYTTAVDMWSVECVTAAILIGRPVFATSQFPEDRQNSAAAVIDAGAQCDLRALDDPEVWGDIDPGSKDFIRRLLVLDEQFRLTADQAILHGWFTQERNGQPILARYEQAVAGWKPSWPGWDFKDHLDRFIDTRISNKEV
ncbi:MAG: hypothetical protein Q9209_003017 [Squamulea sp. 1 TL-2023]